MTVQYGDVIYNPTAVWIAQWIQGNTFGTPIQIDYQGKLSFKYDADRDELKSGGKIREVITIPTKVTGTIEEMALNFPAWGLLTGFAATEYSTTPNRYYRAMPRLGGEGLPYVGLIVAYAAIGGANLLCGFPKFKLDSVPPFDVDQNKFRKGSSDFTAVAAGDSGYAGVYQKYETAAQIPTTAGTFLQFFTTPINVFN